MQDTANNTKQRHASRTRGQWITLISELEQSDLSVDQFCALNDVSVFSLNKWRSVFKSEKRRDDSPLFVEVTPSRQHQQSQSHWDIELDLAPGMVLRLRRPC